MRKCVTIFPTIQQRIVIDCVIGSPDFDNTSVDSNNVICKALIDTGAMCTCISSRVADFLSLQPTGTMIITGANNHSDLVNTHIVNLTLGGEIRFEMIKVPRLNMTDQDLIIGMDLISKGDMVLKNSSDGTVFMFQKN